MIRFDSTTAMLAVRQTAQHAPNHGGEGALVIVRLPDVVLALVYGMILCIYQYVRVALNIAFLSGARMYVPGTKGCRAWADGGGGGSWR